ncbi:unnamed protein product, partial [Clavelina lepadiformis]
HLGKFEPVIMSSITEGELVFGLNDLSSLKSVFLNNLSSLNGLSSLKFVFLNDLSSLSGGSSCKNYLNLLHCKKQ